MSLPFLRNYSVDSGHDHVAVLITASITRMSVFAVTDLMHAEDLQLVFIPQGHCLRGRTLGFLRFLLHGNRSCQDGILNSEKHSTPNNTHSQTSQGVALCEVLPHTFCLTHSHTLDAG